MNLLVEFVDRFTEQLDFALQVCLLPFDVVRVHLLRLADNVVQLLLQLRLLTLHHVQLGVLFIEGNFDLGKLVLCLHFVLVFSLKS